MAVEAGKSGDRKIVQVTWDKEAISGEVVILHCENPANGDVSVSGVSKNDGVGFVTYPPGYTGETVVTVLDNDQNADTGTISVTPEGAETVPPTEPEQPPPDLGIWPNPPEGQAPLPEHPIVIPPILDDDFWTGNLPPYDHPQPVEE